MLVNIDAPSGELTGKMQALGMRLQRILFQGWEVDGGLKTKIFNKGNYEQEVELF